MKKYLTGLIIALFTFIISATAMAAVNPAPPEVSPTYNLSDYFGLVGDATVDADYKNVIKPVVPMGKYSLGAMWSKQKIDLRKDFTLQAYVYMENKESRYVADGMTMTFHNDPKGLKALGSNGESIGAYGYHRDGNNRNPAIQNALSIELDSWLNNDSTDKGMYYSHMAYMRPGNTNEMLVQRAHNSYAREPALIEYLKWHEWRLLTVYWDSSEKTFETTLSNINTKSGQPIKTVAYLKSYPLDIQKLFGGNEVYWGLTSATGAETGNIYMAMKQMPNVNFGTISKRVGNVTKNETATQSTTKAFPGDELRYKLSFENENAFYRQIVFDDVLEDGQEVKKDSTRFEIFDKTDKLVSEGKISDSNWNKGTFKFEDIRSSDFGRIDIYYDVIVKEMPSKTSWVISNEFHATTDNGLTDTSNKTQVEVDNSARFSHNVERTKNELKLYDSIFVGQFDKKYTTLKIGMPDNTEIEKLDSYLPTTWVSKGKTSSGSINNYEFEIGQNNSLDTIKQFFNQLQFQIKSDVDREGSISALFTNNGVGELEYTAPIPQKIYIKGFDTKGALVPKGDKTIETALRLNKEEIFEKNDVPNYKYLRLEKNSGEVISPEVFRVTNKKQEAKAIYEASISKIHLRQEVVSQNEEVVLPKTGYSSITLNDENGNSKKEMTAAIVSFNEVNQEYSSYSIALEEESKFLNIESIVPMYYSLTGYTVTTKNDLHSVNQSTPNFNVINIEENNEVWVTIYIKPSQDRPSFYSWDYGEKLIYQIKK